MALAGTARGAPPTTKVNGAYDVVIAGAYTGTGNAAVAANSVNINATVTDRNTGQSGRLKAKLARNGDRFTGTGTVLGVTVTIEGRVDAADGTAVKSDRLQLTFADPTGTGVAAHAGRIVGHRKGG